ncbi:MAG: UDP-N-acetylmuramoyl-L-alanyl-D-glutamate--2,6-diaminopimelate ligase, partial [Fusobacteriaceae bacterium]
TVEYKIGKEIIEAVNTTPESLDIIKMCKKSVECGMEYLIMEVSSHALALGRVDMLEFDVGVFTNLTPDHLDFHKNMENYFDSKAKLFEKIKDKKNCVINIDDSSGKKYFEKFGGISYGLESGNLRGKYLGSKNLVNICYDNFSSDTKIKLLGTYNLYNILGSIGACLSLGINFNDILSKIENLKGAPGRFEVVDCGQEFTAIVDYAHTEDALLNLLKTVKELNGKKIITVFGCGGDRDKTKRPFMAKVSEKYSDIIIITADNPRTENIDDIITDMIAGVTDKNKLIVEPDRELAIIQAVKLAEKNDIIVVAGKGHETYQVLGRDKYHFDDREYLRREFTKLKK